MKFVNTSIRKKDAVQLVTGKPVYTEDIAPSNCLVVKLMKSPYANAIIEDINTAIAEKVPGVEKIITYKDVNQKRFTLAGQSYPEASPCDRLVLDKHLRYVGDPVAIVAAENEKAAIKAIKLIKVKYNVLEPLLDPRKAKDNEILIHPEDSWYAQCPVGADNKRNLVATGCDEDGNVDEIFKECDVVIERTYKVKPVQQTMMEPFKTYTEMDNYGRIKVVSSTQIPFHVRRIVANALGIEKSKVRVIKPRIGGGFGAKQTAVSEIYPAIVTYLTGKPAMIVYTREETQTISSPRHGMEVTVKLGVMKDGTMRCCDMYVLSNSGAYGEHGPTTVGLAGHKSMALYSKMEAFRFKYDVVYTNIMSSGAYRGYGATQGIYALESCVDEMAKIINIDPIEFRFKNMTREGMFMPAYYGETANACTLDKCLEKAIEMSNRDKYYPAKDMGNGKIRAMGAALAMQSSSISNLDIGGMTLKLGDGGFYNMIVGCTDMGTGCDTILAQMVADVLDTDVDNIATFGVDTDVSPYDSGSYASSTTYLTGRAAVKCATQMRDKIIEVGSKILDLEKSKCEFDGKFVYEDENPDNKISLADIVTKAQSAPYGALVVTVSEQSTVSPPPFMAGVAEIEVDKETGVVELINFSACVDCGTVINPNLARVQTEGGLVQGIGMAMYEDIIYGENGRDFTNSLMQYKIPTRLDMGNIDVAFESSYEPTGPFGAKSIGEIVINTPAPAICNAISNAVGVRIRELPATPVKVLKGIMENSNN